jgi:hypothetical protein
LIRGHPDVVPTPYQVRGKLQSGTISKTGSRFSPGTLDSGFRRNDAFFVKTVVDGQTLSNIDLEKLDLLALEPLSQEGEVILIIFLREIGPVESKGYFPALFSL